MTLSLSVVNYLVTCLTRGCLVNGTWLPHGWLPNGCQVVAIGCQMFDSWLPSSRQAVVKWLPTGCQVVSVWLLCGCKVRIAMVATWLPSVCQAVPSRLSSGGLRAKRLLGGLYFVAM